MSMRPPTNEGEVWRGYTGPTGIENTGGRDKPAACDVRDLVGQLAVLEFAADIRCLRACGAEADAFLDFRDHVLFVHRFQEKDLVRFGRRKHTVARVAHFLR